MKQMSPAFWYSLGLITGATLGTLFLATAVATLKEKPLCSPPTSTSAEIWMDNTPEAVVTFGGTTLEI